METADNLSHLFALFGQMILLIVLVVDGVLLLRWLHRRLLSPRRCPAASPEAGVAAPPPRWSLVYLFLGTQAFVLAVALIGTLLPESASWVGLYLQNACCVLLTVWLLSRYGTRLSAIGLYRPVSPRFERDLLLGISLGAVMLALGIAVEIGVALVLQRWLGVKVLESLREISDQNDAAALFLRQNGFWPRLLFCLGGAIAAPLGEEIFFRGLLYNAMKQRMHVVAAMVWSGLVFALVHGNPMAVFAIFPMGVLLAWAYERTGSLWVCIVIHAVNNGAAFLLLWLDTSVAK